MLLSNWSNFQATLYAYDGVLTLAHKNISVLQTNLNVELPKISRSKIFRFRGRGSIFLPLREHSHGVDICLIWLLNF